MFLIQNTQNRSTKAMQLKLDELIKAVTRARTKFEGIEDLSEEELDALKQQLEKQLRRKKKAGR